MVDYYPFTWRLRNIDKGNIIVDFTAQGVVLVEADGDISLVDFGDLSPPIPHALEFINNAQVSDPLIDSPLLLL